MKEHQDYIHDLAEIRSMMERSSKFLSLSGLAGVLAGLYAIAGAYIAYYFFNFRPDSFEYPINLTGDTVAGIPPVAGLAALVLVLAIVSVMALSSAKARAKGESAWNPTSRRMLSAVAVPLLTGGVLLIITISAGYAGLAAPVSLIFYGLALFTASQFTFKDIQYFGYIQIILGLISALFISYSILIWAVGFGALHIVYGLFIHFKYERS